MPATPAFRVSFFRACAGLLRLSACRNTGPSPGDRTILCPGLTNESSVAMLLLAGQASPATIIAGSQHTVHRILHCFCLNLIFFLKHLMHVFLLVALPFLVLSSIPTQHFTTWTHTRESDSELTKKTWPKAENNLLINLYSMLGKTEKNLLHKIFGKTN